MILQSSVLVVVLVFVSAVCSGLNIALMSLKTADLRRKALLGDKRAIRVLPLRTNSHLSLASIILTNVAVISATSLVLGQFFNGIIAGISSTLLIVIFGEIIPQALFVSHALLFCSMLTPALLAMIIVTYPISKPLQLLLDTILGNEIAPLQSRHELGLLIGEHAASEETELDDNELDIIRGALQLSEKRVRNIMTPMSRVYWLTPKTMIDTEKIREIKLRGFSRIPVFDLHRTELLGVLIMKDLVNINFEDSSHLVSELPFHTTRTIGSMTALDTLFRHFIVAHSHLMAVEKDNKLVGIVTIEDLIEEIIGHEIEDESDRSRNVRTV